MQSANFGYGSQMQVEDSELVHQFKGESPIRTLRYLLSGQRKNVALAIFFFSIKHSPAWLIPIITANLIDIVVQRKSTVDLAINSAALVFVVVQNFPTNLLILSKEIKRNHFFFIWHIQCHMYHFLQVKISKGKV